MAWHLLNRLLQCQRFKFPTFRPHDFRILQVFHIIETLLRLLDKFQGSPFLWYIKGKGGCDTMVIVPIDTVPECEAYVCEYFMHLCDGPTSLTTKVA